MIFSHFAILILEKTIVNGSLVDVTSSSEFHKGGTFSSAVATSSGLCILSKFDQVSKTSRI